MLNDISTLKDYELLKLHSQIMKELRSRGVLRSANSPTGDLGEYIVCRAMGLNQEGNSTQGYDATDNARQCYQIKARRLERNDTASRQLSALRDLGEKKFHFLVGVLFDRDYVVYRAALIPHSVVVKYAKYQKHTNSHIFHLKDNIWDIPEVEDITEKLRSFGAANA